MQRFITKNEELTNNLENVEKILSEKIQLIKDLKERFLNIELSVDKVQTIEKNMLAL